jgi:hypothetical protein
MSRRILAAVALAAVACLSARAHDVKAPAPEVSAQFGPLTAAGGTAKDAPAPHPVASQTGAPVRPDGRRVTQPVPSPGQVAAIRDAKGQFGRVPAPPRPAVEERQKLLDQLDQLVRQMDDLVDRLHRPGLDAAERQALLAEFASLKHRFAESEERLARPAR